VTHFEELQVMKFAWRNNIGNHATWNLSQVEEINDEMGEYQDILVTDREQARWDHDVKVVSFYST